MAVFIRFHGLESIFFKLLVFGLVCGVLALFAGMASFEVAGLLALTGAASVVAGIVLLIIGVILD
jgi:hypothetical protein